MGSREGWPAGRSALAGRARVPVLVAVVVAVAAVGGAVGVLRSGDGPRAGRVRHPGVSGAAGGGGLTQAGAVVAPAAPTGGGGTSSTPAVPGTGTPAATTPAAGTEAGATPAGGIHTGPGANAGASTSQPAASTNSSWILESRQQQEYNVPAPYFQNSSHPRA